MEFSLPLLLGFGLLSVFSGGSDSGSEETHPDTEPLPTDDGDTILLTNGADVFLGSVDDDDIDGGFGFDTISGGDGNDTIEGGDGKDDLFGGNGSDSLSGGAWHDTLTGGTGFDDLDGGNGNDELYGGDGKDLLEGGDGNDELYGGSWIDGLFGGDGDDILLGVPQLVPEISSEDYEANRTDPDFELADASIVKAGFIGDNDVLSGGDGDDILILSNDVIAIGGDGNDTFVLGDWIANSQSSMAVIDEFDHTEDIILVALSNDNLDAQIRVESLNGGRMALLTTQA